MAKEKNYKSDNLKEEFIKIKHRGKIFTPDYLVDDILNQGHYLEGNINKKHVIDNSCGDGQFLIHIVDRYCKDFLKEKTDVTKLKSELETYIHGIEIDLEDLKICKERCSQVAELYNVKSVNWDFINANTLKTNKFDGKMDFVLGNPPYVRVHNLNDDIDVVKSYLFGIGGMTDLYIVFYEKCLRMLNENGILCYITPSSFFTSVAGSNMRQHFNNNYLIESICDLKHFQPFNAITYTAIVCLNKSYKKDLVKYFEFNESELKQKFVTELKQSEYIINNNYYFSRVEKLNLLRRILNNLSNTDIKVKNGYATLADKVFINNFDFDSKYIIPAVKGSRAKWTKIFYPYNENGKLVDERELKKDEKIYNYLLGKKEELIKRSNEKDPKKFWYAFGRSQGINDTYKNKIGINSLIIKSSDLKITDVKAGSGLYSGLYIISDEIKVEKIKRALLDEEFGVFVSLLGKYKSGGYYTFSSKDVKNYLDYKLGGEICNVKQ